MKSLLFLAVSISFISSAFAATNGWKPKYETKKIKTSLKKKKSSKKEKTIAKVQSEEVKEAKEVEIKKLVPPAIKKHPLYSKYKRNYKAKAGIEKLKAETLKLQQDAVPLLTYVMKTDDFPDNNRWVATFMLGKIMGKKAAAFISKFSFHPNFMLRLASLKSLLALNQVQYKGIYSRLLKDKAMIVRVQALENIRAMKLTSLAPYVWAMLYDKENYSMSEGVRKRGSIIKTVIKTMGDLGFEKAKKPMLTMIQKKKYSDIHEELDYSLSKLSESPSPSGDLSIKRHFWKKQADGDGFIL